jgi:hypothetical protein
VDGNKLQEDLDRIVHQRSDQTSPYRVLLCAIVPILVPKEDRIEKLRPDAPQPERPYLSCDAPSDDAERESDDGEAVAEEKFMEGRGEGEGEGEGEACLGEGWAGGVEGGGGEGRGVGVEGKGQARGRGRVEEGSGEGMRLKVDRLGGSFVGC